MCWGRGGDNSNSEGLEKELAATVKAQRKATEQLQQLGVWKTTVANTVLALVLFAACIVGFGIGALGMTSFWQWRPFMVHGAVLAGLLVSRAKRG